MRGGRGVLVALLAVAAYAKEPSAGKDASAARKEEISQPNFTLVGGVGAAYLGLGVDLAFEVPHLEPFVALGVMTILRGFVGGARLFWNAGDRGPVLTLTGGQFLGVGDRDVPTYEGFSATAGYRFTAPHGLFVEAGAGLISGTLHYEGDPPYVRTGLDVDLGFGCSF